MASRQLSGHAKHVLQALKTQKCVLIKGVPAAGKSRLLAEIESAFVQSTGAQVGGNQTILVPAGGAGLSALLPSPRRSDRRRWSLVMNQNTRYRDFLRAPQAKLDGGQGFELSKGALYRANEHAKTPDGAALVTIDELNRGPAVQVFGPSIVAIEAVHSSARKIAVPAASKTALTISTSRTSSESLDHRRFAHTSPSTMYDRAPAWINSSEVAFIQSESANAESEP